MKKIKFLKKYYSIWSLYTLTKLKQNCFIYIALAKYCWVIKLEEFESSQKKPCQINQEILKTSKNNPRSSKAFQLMCTELAKVCLGGSTICLIYCAAIQVMSEKTLPSKSFTSNLRDIFTWKLTFLSFFSPFLQTKSKIQVLGLVIRNISVFCL